MKNARYKLNKSSKIPLYVQLYQCFKDDILSGNIIDNERLPSRRVLIDTLGLGKNTIEMAYQKLVDDGYAVSKSRSGYFARSSSPINTDISEPNFYDTPGIIHTMSQNGIDIDSIPKATLSKYYRDITYDMPQVFEYGHKYGETTLRKTIAHYFYHIHGISCTADQIIIGSGTEFLLEQLTHLFDIGTVFGFENPCFARSYIPIKNSGKQTKLIDIDINGFDTNELYKNKIDVMYLSPNHHFPTGYRMTDTQRKKILKWIKEDQKRYVIESDFDFDFSDKGGLEPLFSADESDKVIFIGSFYRTIAPSFKTSFMILPKKLKEKLDQCLPYYTCLASRIEQQVIAKYIQSGKYQRHLERLNTLYTEKYQRLITEIKNSELWKYSEIHGANAGTHIILTLGINKGEFELKTLAAKYGVKVLPLSACLISITDKLPPKSFILGYGELSEDNIRDSVNRLNEAWVPK